MINLKINNKDIEIESGSTILEAAKKINVNIPTLCHLDLHGLGLLNQEASCRVCMVETKNGKMVPACNTLVKEGMEIRTDTLKVINTRKVMIELLLSNHPKDCLVCVKSGNCELQELAEIAHIDRIRFEGEVIKFPVDDKSLSIVRDPNKCILCKRCETICTDVQTVGTLTTIGRGFDTIIGSQYNNPMHMTNCTFCGQCLAVCPTGALSEVNNTGKVYDALRSDKIVVVQTAPAVRVALGEEFNMEPGTVVTGKMVTALKNMGFDYVFDTDFAADLTTIEEAAELVHRLEHGGRLPILTSCCPSWVKFFEHNYGDMLDIPSTCKSPHEMFGSIVKSYFAEKNNISPDDIVVVSVMPCVAKKYESARPELSREGYSDVDLVITTRELATMIKDFSMLFTELPDTEFDNPFGESSGAGALFGASGGVLESALRTAYYMITGKDLEKLEFHNLRGLKGFKEAEIDIEGKTLKVAVASGLGNARKLLDDIESGTEHYDVIEIMACPGGCIDGAGQPFIHGDVSIIEKRMQAMHSVDTDKDLRLSYKNESIKKLYEDYLGEPYGKKAHELLHTEFVRRGKHG